MIFAPCATHTAAKDSQMVVNGGVCMKHDARIKRCSRDGCKNQAKKGEVYMEHEAQTMQ